MLLPLLAAIALGGPDGPRPEALVQQQRLLDALKSLPTARSVMGDVASQQGLVATEDLIVKSLKDLGYTPRLQDLTWNLKYQAEQEQNANIEPANRRAAKETTDELAAHTWHNIIVDIPGKNLPAEVLVLSAHFDAVPGAPGADDDGSGTAALLEIARVLKDQPMRRTVRLIFFNLEEIGLVGSKEYVRSIRPELLPGPDQQPPKQTIIGMASLEMLGYFTDAPDSQKSPIPKIEGVFDPPTVGDFIGLITVSGSSPFCRRLNAEMRKAAPELKTGVADFPPIAPPDFLRSDHAPFLFAGVPALMLTDTSNYRNPNYHRPTDTIDTLDPVRYTLVVRAVAGAAYSIAEPAQASPQK